MWLHNTTRHVINFASCHHGSHFLVGSSVTEDKSMCALEKAVN